MLPRTTLLQILRDTILGMVAQDVSDLTARQLAVLLICCREAAAAETVGSLAARLQITPSAISRVLDRLQAFGLVRRVGNPRDRRIVLVAATPSGFAFVKAVADTMKRSLHRR